MPPTPHALPSEVSAAGDFARQLGALVGPAVQAPDGSVAACDYLALGEALADLHATALASLAEAFAGTASRCLGEWEDLLGLPVRVDLPDAARRAMLTAKLRTYRGGSAQAIARALDTLASTPVTILETDVATVTAARDVFRFAVVLSAADFADADLVARLDALVQAQKPAYARPRFVQSAVFRFSTSGHGFDDGVFS